MHWNIKPDLAIDFSINLPIIQAPMAGVQDSELALAVSSVGGLGSLPCGMLDHEILHAELSKIKEQTTKPININFFCHEQPKFDAAKDAKWKEILQPHFEEFDIDPNSIPTGASRKPFDHNVADVVEAFKPEVVSFHFGLPEKKLLQRVKDWGATVLSSATTVAEAQWLEANGADVIIAQGSEAGGHRAMFLSDDVTTQVGTFALLPQIVEKVDLPVIAAGGIANAKTVAAALSLGASAVQVGTAYLLCTEAKTRKFHREALKSDAVQHTVLTNIFSGKPARGIVNRIIQDLGSMASKVPEYPFAAAAVTAIRNKAEAQDSADFSPLWCGQNASGCKEISATELTKALALNLD